LRGRLGEAEDWYRQSLTIKEDLNNRPGMALSYHQLGIIAQNRGRLQEAEDWYCQSLTITEDLDDRPGMALSFGQLGLLAEERGRPREALEWMVRCVSMFDEFPHPATGPGPQHLARLGATLGIDVARRCWVDVTGHPPPPTVVSFLEAGRAEQS
jgi:tetratricopeptide (TPR) repeat protein